VLESRRTHGSLHASQAILHGLLPTDPSPFAHTALPGDHRSRRSRGRFFNIDLINKLEADSLAARLHRQLVKPAI
jgi:hypothetical protein